jgi:anti-sigma factor RsiW
MSDRFNCAELATSVTEYFEGAFDKARRKAFERHLARCVDCDMYLRQMRQTIEITGRLAAADVESIPFAVRQQLLEAFRSSTPAGPPD